jgi:hypothetical protein
VKDRRRIVILWILGFLSIASAGIVVIVGVVFDGRVIQNITSFLSPAFSLVAVLYVLRVQRREHAALRRDGNRIQAQLMQYLKTVEGDKRQSSEAKQLLVAMNPGVQYSLEQLSSAAMVPPKQAQEVLVTLAENNLIKIVGKADRDVSGKYITKLDPDSLESAS